MAQSETIPTMRNEGQGAEDGATSSSERTAGSNSAPDSPSAALAGSEQRAREKKDENSHRPSDGLRDTKGEGEGESEGRGGLIAKLPDWFMRALKEPRAWKNFFRCMVATLATMVVMLTQRSLAVLGSAGFFGLIMSQMLPPSMALSVYIFAFLTLVIGMCFGWAWGCAAMAAALRARSQVLLQQDVQREQASYTTDTNLDLQYQESIFRGAFLDPRSSAVYGVFFFIGAYGLGFLRAKYPRLTLGAIFGTIILDLMCSYGPLFPIQQYTLANNLLLPAACFLAIALACTILIFPQSLHSIVLNLFATACLGPIKGLLDLQGAILASTPSDREKWPALAEKAYELRKLHVMGSGGVDGQIKLLGLEVSHGRFGAVELVRLVEKSKELGARAYSLASFVMILDERAKAIAKVKDDGRQHRRREHLNRMESRRHPGTGIDDLIPILAATSAPLRSVCSSALGEIIAYLNAVNHSRWGKIKVSVPDDSLAKLRSEIEAYRRENATGILAPFRDAFTADGRLRQDMVGKLRYSARDLFTCYLLTTSLTYFATVLAEMLELVLAVQRDGQKNKWHFPTNVAKAMKDSAVDKSGGNPLDMHRGSEETLVEPEVEEGKDGKKAKRPQRQWAKDPDATDPRNGLQRFGRGLYRFWQGLTGVNGIFALKYGIVSIALWIPQVVESSAYFTYTNRGLWALIMAQTGMGVFTGEQIGSFFLRMAGTLIGLVFGMVAWYIGAQEGSGNPYGVAAATMVIIALPLFIRVTAPMQSPPMIVSLMTGVTIMFVVGYSWVDEHLYQTANQGAGAGLAGRRALLVIIGFTAAFIVMLFPRPMSARKIVRHSLARTLIEISDLYAAMISGVEEEVDWADGNGDQDKEAEIVGKRKARQALYRGQFVKIMERMGRTAPQMQFATLEPGLKGPWPKASYFELQHLQVQIVSALALLSGCYARLDVSWAKRLESRSELMHPAFIADCLALFSLLHQSLRNGHPLPTTMPIFERLGYHAQHRSRAQGSPMSLVPRRRGDSVDQSEKEHAAQAEAEHAEAEHELDADAEVVQGEERIDKQEEKVVRDLGQDFHFDTLKDEQFALFAVANVSLIHITSCLNEIHRVVLGLVGERELVGFEKTQERWARLELGTGTNTV